MSVHLYDRGACQQRGGGDVLRTDRAFASAEIRLGSAFRVVLLAGNAASCATRLTRDAPDVILV